jgi:cytochrome P450
VIDFTAGSVLGDPYPAYAAQRRSAPLAFEDSEEAWLVFGYDLMRLMAKNSALSAAADMSFVDLLPAGDRWAAELLAEHYKSWLLFSDGDRHTRLRNMISPIIGPRWVNEVRPEVARRLYGELQQAPGELDAVSGYAMPVAQWTLSRALGIGEELLHAAPEWSAELLEFINVDITRAQALRTAAVIQDMGSVVGNLESLKPRTGSAGEIIVRMLHDGQLTAADATGVVGQLVTGFLGALPYLVANGAVALWGYATEHPGDSVLSLDFDLLTEEVIRYDPPFLLVARTATADVAINDCPVIYRGDRVGYMLGSINRDERTFPRADQFDPYRRGSPHLSFGAGMHYCLGAHITRAFVTAAFRALTAAYDPWRSVLAPVSFKPYFGMRMPRQVLISAGHHTPRGAGVP